MPTLPSPEQTGSRSGQLRISPWAQEVGRPCGYEGHQAGLQLHMPSKHIVFTQFWGSAGRGRTHGNSGGPTASPAIPTLPLGYSTLVITLLLKSLRGSPVLLGQIQIPAWGAQGLPPTLSALYLIPPPPYSEALATCVPAIPQMDLSRSGFWAFAQGSHCSWNALPLALGYLAPCFSSALSYYVTSSGNPSLTTPTKSVPPSYFVICPDRISFFPSSTLITGAIMFLCGLFA